MAGEAIAIPQGSTLEPIQSQSIPIPSGASVEDLQSKRNWLDSATDLAKGIWSQVNPVAGVQGAAQLAAHPIDTYKADAGSRQELLDKAQDAFKKGDYVTGMAHALNGIIPFLGPQMDAAGQNIQQGNVATGVGQSIGMGLNMAAPEVVKGVAAKLPAVTGEIANRMYQSSLKPPPGSFSSPEVASMVKTGLENEIPVSAAGAAKLQDLVTDLNQKVRAQIAAGSNQGASINKFSVASRLGDTARKFETQVNPESDLNAVSSSGNEFLRNQPNQISALQAQDLKSGTYKQLGDRAYGELTTAASEAQKALARGLKEELQKQFPEIQGLNSKESNLIGLDEALERAVRRTNNRDIFSLGGKIASTTGGVLGAATGGPEGAALGAAAAPVVHYFMSDPMVQSRLAIAVSKASKGSVPIGAARARVAGYLNALGNTSQSDSTMQPAMAQ